MANNTATKKQLAALYGYEMWYDRNLQLWTLTKEGRETLYFPPQILKNMSITMFISQISDMLAAFSAD